MAMITPATYRLEGFRWAIELKPFTVFDVVRYLPLYRYYLMRLEARTDQAAEVVTEDLPAGNDHEEAEDLEKHLISHFQGRASVLVHTDPCLDPNCPVCSLRKCDYRKTDLNHRAVWDVEVTTAKRQPE